jgi:hypothetical protein
MVFIDLQALTSFITTTSTITTYYYAAVRQLARTGTDILISPIAWDRMGMTSRPLLVPAHDIVVTAGMLQSEA